MAESSSPAPAAAAADLGARSEFLRARRQAQGLTQEQLAERSELAVRTVRALESGTHTSPRASSLVRLATALRLSAAQRTELLEFWDRGENFNGRSSLDYFGPGSGGPSPAEAARAVWTDFDLESVIGTTQIGADGWFASNEQHRVVTARRNDLVGTHVICEPARGEEFDINRVRLNALEGCVVRQQTVFPEKGISVFELGFGRALRRGESHAYRYQSSHESSVDDPSPEPAPRSDSTGVGFLRPVKVFALRVKFDRARLPARCAQVYRVRHDMPLRETAALPIDRSGVVQIVVIDAVPGSHGIAWHW